MADDPKKTNRNRTGAGNEGVFATGMTAGPEMGDGGPGTSAVIEGTEGIQGGSRNRTVNNKKNNDSDNQVGE